MGYTRHHAIVVTTWNEEAAARAHAAATAIGLQVSEIITSPVNFYRTFLVAPDGSSEGWSDSNVGNERRGQFIAWMNTQRHEDASTPLSWVEVQYGDDEGQTLVVNHSDAEENQIAGTLP